MLPQAKSLPVLVLLVGLLQFGGMLHSGDALAQSVCGSIDECRGVISAAQGRIAEIERENAERERERERERPAYGDEDQATYWYAGQHRENDGSWCWAEGRHAHNYWPAHANWFAVADGVFYWQGPQDFTYYAGHPIPGGGWCPINGPHQHNYFPPRDSSWRYDNGRYVYHGPYNERVLPAQNYWSAPVRPVLVAPPSRAQPVSVRPQVEFSRPVGGARVGTPTPDAVPYGRPAVAPSYGGRVGSPTPEAVPYGRPAAVPANTQPNRSYTPPAAPAYAPAAAPAQARTPTFVPPPVRPAAPAAAPARKDERKR